MFVKVTFWLDPIAETVVAPVTFNISTVEVPPDAEKEVVSVFFTVKPPNVAAAADATVNESAPAPPSITSPAVRVVFEAEILSLPPPPLIVSTAVVSV
jgi:hypothetical protein